jgi:hypothetical protein
VFVNQSDAGADGHNVEYMQNAWLFFAVSIPLTLFTIMVWYTWSHFGAIIDIFTRKTGARDFGFGEAVKMVALLRTRRELPR